MKVGENLEVTVDGKIMTIKIDITKDFGLSASGKNNIVASSHGNVTIDGTDGVVLGLNAYKRRPR